MILTAALVAWIGRTALGSFEAWQQAFESARPYLRAWRALLYGALFAFWWDLFQRYRDRPKDRLRVKRIGTLGLLLFTCVELTRL
nr:MULTISPECIES: hypothetical protein [unclassified Pseudomonas]